MAKKIIIVNSTYREGGNSEILASAFGKGAAASGHSVKTISLRDLKLCFCTGCLYCQSHDKCILKDDINALLPVIRDADILVFASPVYYYGISGQLKTFLDRLNPLYVQDYKFRQVYLLSAAAEQNDSAADGSINAVRCWIDCFEDVSLAGIIKGSGASAPGDILSGDAANKAYIMGKGILL